MVFEFLVNVVSCVWMLIWILIEVLKQRARDSEMRSRVLLPREVMTSRTVCVLCGLIVSVSYLGFGVINYWRQGVVSYKSVLCFMTWSIASVILIYSNSRTYRGLNKWPLILILWCIFSFTLDLVCVLSYLLAHLMSIKLPGFMPEATIVEFVVFPFLMVLFCSSLQSVRCERRQSSEFESLLPTKDETHTYSNVGVWSKLTFHWVNPLFANGRAQKLELSNIPSIPPSETAECASSLLEECLLKQETGTLSLPKVIASAIWMSLAINAVYAGVNTIASYTGPYLIKNFVNFLSEKQDSSYNYGLVLAAIFFLSKTVESLTQRQWYFGAQRMGIQVKAALTVLIYKKSLSIKSSGPSSGTVINLINVDVERIGDFFLDIHGIWLLPVQVLLAFIILYSNLGAIPSTATLLATILVVVCNTPLAKTQKKFHSKIMQATDLRIKATSETLKSMRVLKLLSWETMFMKKLFQLRETERDSVKSYLYVKSVIAFLFWASPTVVSVITFGVCILVKTPLTSGTVLSALATFRILQEPIYNLPELISMVAQTKVSVDRIQEFMKGKDQQNSILNISSAASDVAIDIKEGEYAWETSNQKLNNTAIKISQRLQIKKGCKVALCGSVGSGKSSLLCSILGEIPRTSGAAVTVHGSKAYVPQTAWIQTGTIRDNVIFGKEMNKALYEEVIEGCALNHDIEMWVDRDLTVVGERGINLSGGQKQRIQLARAAYSDADIYILDDPFSAVDAHTGTHLFKKCLRGLLSEKTVLYATHQLEFLAAADLVLVIKEGKIVQSGKFEDLTADVNGELIKQMNTHRKSLNQVKPSQEDQSSVHLGGIGATEKIISPISDTKSADKTSMEAETGRVRWSVYTTFVTLFCKGALVPVMLLCQVLFQVLQMASNYWIAWATDEQRSINRVQLITIFALLSGGSSAFMLGRIVLLTVTAIMTAKRLFMDMTTSVFRAPMSFFDSTPSSRILTRSSTDQSTVDTDIPYRLAGLVFALIQLLSIIFLMSQVAWQVFPFFLVILGISIWYQAYYISTARELARMVGIQKAPIMHHFTETISGAAIIRCFNQEERFIMKSLNVIDDYSHVAFHNSATMEWLSVRINFLFNFVFFLVLIILVTLPRSAIDPSMAGLVATYGLNMNVLQAWVIWNLCNVENKMISVERILQFVKLPKEAPLVIKEHRPDSEWPTTGKIELENLQVQYTPALPMVLKGITCTFPGGKKIGVVGRTGSGKSTLIQALFRMVEPSEGRILIDGLDISEIGPYDLRSRLGIIPQDPTLFQGTVRTNLDPLEEHSDPEIWEVINKCRLKDIIKQDRRLLDAPVAEDGENWSLGQRQLICLARVLLKKRRILVLDEATASIDTATDNVIQEAIKEETNKCTVITVAHRIPTVIDNDLVLVLDQGKVAEYDSPEKLLEESASSFGKLVTEFLRRSSER